jgi:hypothetical protein
MPLDKADKSALGIAAKVTNSGVSDSDQNPDNRDVSHAFSFQKSQLDNV